MRPRILFFLLSSVGTLGVYGFQSITARNRRRMLAAWTCNDGVGLHPFSCLGITTSLLSRVKYEKPSAIQDRAIPVVMSGADMIAEAPTGSGKTVAYALPILETLLKQGGGNGRRRRPYALVLVPTRELAQQVGWAFETLLGFDQRGSSGDTVLVVHGGVGARPQASALERGMVDILVATPGRLLDLTENARETLLSDLR